MSGEREKALEARTLTWLRGRRSDAGETEDLINDLLSEFRALEERCEGAERELRDSREKQLSWQQQCLAAEAEVKRLRDALCRDPHDPWDTDISDFSDEWCAGFLAGQENAQDVIEAAALVSERDEGGA